MLASVLSPVEFEVMRQKLNRLPPPPTRSTLSMRDWLGSAAVFLAVFLSTFPVAIPFLFISNVRLALRLSNSVAVGMLFLAGYAFGVYTDHRPWRTGLGMAIIGSLTRRDRGSARRMKLTAQSVWSMLVVLLAAKSWPRQPATPSPQILSLQSSGRSQWSRPAIWCRMTNRT